MTHLNPGNIITHQTLHSSHGETVEIPHPTRLTHLQFRRFAGCPVCNLHVHEFFDRYPELVDHNIQEVVVFQSSDKAMNDRLSDAPFPLVADSEKTLYEEFGVESSIPAIFNLRMMPSMVKGVWRHGLKLPETVGAAFNLPAEFLIDSAGNVVAAKYGKNYDDQWDVDELIHIVDAETTHSNL